MSHWNYRVLRKVHDGEEHFSIHEVYYDDDSNPNACSIDPISPYGETPDGLKLDIGLMLKALDKPIMDYEYFENLSKEKN